MLAKDVVSVDLSTEFSILAVITRESLGTVEESNCSLLQQFITLRKSDISMNALIIIQAFYFNLSMIKQMENNLRSKTDYKEIRNDLHIALVQVHCTPLTKQLRLSKDLAK